MRFPKLNVATTPGKEKSVQKIEMMMRSSILALVDWLERSKWVALNEKIQLKQHVQQSTMKRMKNIAKANKKATIQIVAFFKVVA